MARGLSSLEWRWWACRLGTESLWRVEVRRSSRWRVAEGSSMGQPSGWRGPGGKQSRAGGQGGWLSWHRDLQPVQEGPWSAPPGEGVCAVGECAGAVGAHLGHLPTVSWGEGCEGTHLCPRAWPWVWVGLWGKVLLGAGPAQPVSRQPRWCHNWPPRGGTGLLPWGTPPLLEPSPASERCMVLSLSGVVRLEAGSPPALVKASGQG